MTKHTAEEVREHSILKWSNKQTDVYLNAYAELLAEKENNEITHWNGTTHYAGCIQAGPKHYECALQEIGRLRGTIMDLRVKLETADNRNTRNYYADGYEAGYQAGMAEFKPWVGLTDDGTEKTTYYFGMILLDYFSAKAMPLCTNTDDGAAARWCYDRAAAMIKEREKRK
jgi:hypothetical protein